MIFRKIILFFTFLFVLQVGIGQSRPDEKLVTYTSYNKPLKQVLKDLSDISGVNLVYSDSRIPSTKSVTVKAEKEKLSSILSVILDDFNLGYQIVGNQIVIVKNTQENTEFIRIYGYIRDKISGEYLIGANIFLHDRSKGTITNDKGYFSFEVPQQLLRIHFSYLGYKSEIKDFQVHRDTFVHIALQPDGLLNEIIIMDDLLEEEHETPASQQNLHIDKIRATNHLCGEADVFRYLGLQPGVSSAAEGVGGVNVRGGSADQNLVLLDGIPIYNTGHALGIFSVFNANAIKSASFYKGGIPARYAGRLSSVIDVHTKDGNYNKFSGDASLSTIALSGTIEGPIIRDKSSFIISYRRTFLDLWIKGLSKYQNRSNDLEGTTNYFFSDFNGKFNFKLGKTARVTLQTLHSNDEFGNETRNLPGVLREENTRELQWGNKLYALKLDKHFGKSVFSSTTLYNTEYSFNSFRNNLLETQDSIISFKASLYDSYITENGIRQEVDWLLSANHTLKLGGNVHFRKFTPKITNVNEETFDISGSPINAQTIRNLTNGPIQHSNELNLFVEDNINIGLGTNINIGLNYSTIILSGGQQYQAWQPRLAFLTGSEQSFFKAGITRMQQYIHLLTNNGIGLPSDIWLPSTNKLKPQKSWIFNAGFGYKLNSGWKFGSDVYYKIFDNISSFKEGGNLNIDENSDWEHFVPVGTGVAYGVESFIEKVFGKTLLSINYTYSLSDRTFADLNNGQPFPFSLNRKHSIKTSFTYRLSEFSEFLVNWFYMSGNHYSAPLDVSIDINGKPVVIFLEKNNATFPAFHRLDLGFSFYNNYKWGRAKFFIGIYNAYNHTNPFYTQLVRSKSDSNKFEFEQYSLIPFLPTLSYSVSF
jgi:hypothetical protein